MSEVLDLYDPKYLKIYQEHQPFAILGDIHGEYKKLTSVVNRIRKEYKDINIYCTGDLVDRGPDSKDVIDFCIDNNIRCVLGNHDEQMLLALTSDNVDIYKGHIFEGMGGSHTVKSYGVHYQFDRQSFSEYKKKVPQAHITYLQQASIAIYIETKDISYLMTHAGIDNVRWIYYCKEYWRNALTPLENIYGYITCKKDSLLWSHSANQTDLLKYNIKQILGHLPIHFDSPQLYDYVSFLDSGSGKGGVLTGVVYPEEEVFISEK